MSREIAIAAGLGLLAALLYLSILSGAPGTIILAYLTQLPLFLAGLSLGVKASVIAGVVGGVASLVGNDFRSALFFLIVDALPVAILVSQALRWRADESGRIWWYPPGRLVLCLLGLGVAAVLAGTVFLAGVASTPDAGARQLLQHEFPRVFAGDIRWDDVVAVIERIFPGLASFSWLFMLAINAVLAQGTLMRFGRNLRPAPSMVELELPRWVALAFAAAVALGSFGDGAAAFVAGNIAIVLVAGFIFAGLAVVHAAARRLSARQSVLVGAYALMILFGWPILFVAALGLIEQWTGLRRRLALPAPGQGV